MKNALKNEKNRIQSAIAMDKVNYSGGYSNLIKSEIVFVLSNYFELERDKLFTFIDVDDDGYVDIKITGKAKRLKSINLVPVCISEESL